MSISGERPEIHDVIQRVRYEVNYARVQLSSLTIYDLDLLDRCVYQPASSALVKIGDADPKFETVASTQYEKVTEIGRSLNEVARKKPKLPGRRRRDEYYRELEKAFATFKRDMQILLEDTVKWLDGLKP